LGEIDTFSFQELRKSAFTHARRKLKWEAFKELNKAGIDSFYRMPHTTSGTAIGF
jgi:hypothetical protein